MITEEQEQQFKQARSDLAYAENELRNPSGNPYHAQTNLKRARANIDLLERSLGI